MRSRILQLAGAAVLAEATASVLFLPSCGILASGQCADKATCEEADFGAMPNPPDVFIEQHTDPQAADVRQDTTASPDTRADAVNEKPSADVSNENASPTRDVASVDTIAEVADATHEVVSVDAGVDASFDAFADVPADAIYMGDTAACGPCTNTCTPSFVPCCTGDGGCGCIEYFFPVLCL